MFKLINYLRNISKESSIIDFDKVLFEFENILILINFQSAGETKEDILDVFYNLELRGADVKDVDPSFWNLVEISGLFVTDYDFLGWRNDVDFEEKIKSITNKLYITVGIINSIDRLAIASYNIELNDGYDNAGAMCDSPPNFVFNISIEKNYWNNLDFFDKLFNNLSFEQINLADYLIQPYKESEKLKVKDNQKLSILITNTKTRRLGYLKILADFFALNSKIPSIKINSKFEEFSVKYSEQLSNYKNQKGVIQKTRTGNSSEPYLALAKELNLLSSINMVRVPGKSMKVYQVLKEDKNFLISNIFELTLFDKYYFLELLLKNDFLYISTILEVLYVKAAESYSEIVKIFPKYLINKLNKIIEENNYNKDKKEIKNIRIVRDRIRSWEEPEVYLEHVLMPRLNWLYDLEILTLGDDSGVILNNRGTTLFKNICFWSDINHSWIINPNGFLDISAISMFNSVFSNKINKFDSDVNLDKLVRYLDESFIYFKTLAPNRVTSSQAISFIKYKLYFNDDLICENQIIEDCISNKLNKNYIYKIQKQYSDGYIQKIK